MAVTLPPSLRSIRNQKHHVHVQTFDTTVRRAKFVGPLSTLNTYETYAASTTPHGTWCMPPPTLIYYVGLDIIEAQSEMNL